MIQSMIISLPMMVCIILSALLGLSLHDRWDKPKSRLLIYMVVAAFLYLAHSIYFHRLTEAIPFSDTVYSFCNPAVFPLFYIYIEELTTNQPLRWRQWLYLSPAFVCFILVGLLWGTITALTVYSLFRYANGRWVGNRRYTSRGFSPSGYEYRTAYVSLLVLLLTFTYAFVRPLL